MHTNQNPAHGTVAMIHDQVDNGHTHVDTLLQAPGHNHVHVDTWPHAHGYLGYNSFLFEAFSFFCAMAHGRESDIAQWPTALQ
jgi:hypothetical protein